MTPSHGRHWRRAVVIACGLAGAPGWAGVPVSLPEGEDPAVWKGALELAGLEPSSGEPAIAVTVVDGRWQLAARDAQGVLRAVVVDPPKTGSEREEVAVVAQAIARAIGHPDAPPQPTPLPRPTPPPPPPPAATLPPVPRSAGPTATDPAASTVQPAPRPDAVDTGPLVEPGIPASSEPPDPEPAEPSVVPPGPASEPEPEPAPEVAPTFVNLVFAPVPEPAPRATAAEPDARPERRSRVQIALPPLHAGFLVAARQGVDGGAGLEIGAEIARRDDLGLLFDLDVLPQRIIPAMLDPEDFVDRQVATTSVDLSGFWEPAAAVRVAGLGGVGVQTFRQQRTPIDRVLVPYLGASTSVALRERHGWGLRIRVRGIADLVTTELVRPDGSSFRTSNLEARIAFLLQAPGFGDPSRPVSTLPE